MESSVQGLEFLDFTGVSEHEVGELKSVLYGGGCHAVTLPWSPSAAHWAEHVVHSAYPAPVPPMVGGIQAPPPPLGHSGPSWVALPPNPTGEESVNGGPEEPVDGVQMMHPNVSTAMPMYQTILHPQPSVIVSNVTANVNVHSFQPLSSYQLYQNATEHTPSLPESQVPRRPRPTNKIPKRVEPQIRRGVDSPQGTFTSQHQFSPNAAPYIPAQVSPSYPYYRHQATAGIPTPQAMAGSPLYLHPSPLQFPSHVVIGTTYPPVTVYSTPPPPIEQHDAKGTVPYPQQPATDLAVAASLPTPVVPVIPPQPHPSASAVTIPAVMSIQAPVKEDDEEEEALFVSTVIENSKINQLPVADVVKNEESNVVKSPVPVVVNNSKPVATSIQTSHPVTKPPFQSSRERKPPVVDETPALLPIPESPVVQSKTWASLFESRDSKPTATVKPTVQHSVENVAGSHANSTSTAGGSHSVAVNNQSPPSVNNTPVTRKPLKPLPSASPSASSNRNPFPSPCMADDPRLHELGNFLVQYQLEHKAAALQPRGLTNRSNYCYINATLQALFACPPLYNLLKAIARFRGDVGSGGSSKGKSFTPIIDSMVKFMNEFDEMNTSGSLLKGRREKAQARKEEQSPGGGSGIDILPGPAFEPTYIYKMMNVIRNETAFPVEGRQEDAEEFLSCLLNGLNDEMLELQKLANNNISNGDITTNGELYQEPDLDDSNEWKEVTNAKNRQTVTRRTEVAPTPLSLIFQGQLRSSVQRVGNESTDRIQPFFTLPLDIEKAQSVKEALERMVGRDVLEGVTCTKTNQEVEAWQQVTLEQLPLVLLLHLKCFDYKLHTCSKIIKTVEFPIDLKIEQKLMSTVVKTKIKKNSGSAGKDKQNSANTAKDRQYKLFAVVYHDGKEATKGHYITDVFHVGYGVWVRYDDATVKSVSENQVLHPKSPRVPYLLYYRRQDTINISQNARNKSES